MALGTRGKPNKIKTAAEEEYVTRAELIRRLPFSGTQLDVYRDVGMPFDPNTKLYPMSHCVKWIIEAQVRIATKNSPTANRGEAETRKSMAQAQIAELELAEMQGDMVRLEDALKMFADQLTTIRQVLIAIPAKYGQVIVNLPTPLEGQEKLHDIIDEVLTEIQKNHDKD